MRHRREGIRQLIDKIKHGYKVLFISKGISTPFQFQNLLAGALGLGVGLAGLCWSLRDGYFWLSLPSEQKESCIESLITVAGLKNLGNNCFLNSILQSLASSRYFLPYLQNLLVMDDVGDMQKAETLPLMVSLTSLLEELCLVRDENTVVNPKSVMLAMTQYIQGFNLTKQQDASEAFIHLLSSLEKEIIDQYLQLGGSLAEITALSSRIYNQEKGEPNEFEKWKKYFIGPFDGIVGSYLTCQTCSSMLSVDLEFFRSLPLSPVLDGHADIMEGCSILDCLKHFTKVERVDNYRCGRCWHRAALKILSYRTDKDELKIKRLSRCVMLDSCDCKNLLCDEEISWTSLSHALKKLSIIRFPKVLSFHLQRASMNRHGEFIKLQGHISFPLFLDLSPFMDAATNFGQLNSVKFMHNNLPRIGRLFKQQNEQILPHIYQIVGHKTSVESVFESKFKVQSSELLGSELTEATIGDSSEKAVVTETAAGLHQSRTIQELCCTEKVEISSSRSSKSCMYYLFSVVEHYGIPGSGHYAVYRKLAPRLSPGATGEPPDCMNGSWVYISDSKVKLVSEADVLAAEASILFYEKVEADQ